MRNSMILLIGIPGSGKSTFFQRKLAADHVRVNLDTLKTRNREARLIDACFGRNGQSISQRQRPTAGRSLDIL